MFKKHKTEFYPEICCEECNNIIHNHFNCPVCQDQFAGTNFYGEIHEEERLIFSCEECKTEFFIINREQIYDDPEIAVYENNKLNNINKLITVESFLELKKEIQREDGKILFTNGCFDILHSGHISLIKEASSILEKNNKDKLNCLVVALNSDLSVGLLKGKDRPIYSLYERILLLDAVEYVDQIIVFDDISALPLIEKIKPDILIKGGSTNVVVGQELVESYGGMVYKTKEFGDISTTKLIKRLKHE